MTNSASLTPTEQHLARIWTEVLGLDQVNREDDFFDSGGDTLMATKVIMLAKRRWDGDYTVRLLLDNPRLKDLAQRIDQLTSSS